MTTPTWITQAAELAERATAGPWEARYRFGRQTTVSGRQRFPICDTGTAPLAQASQRREEANAAFIANARTSVPRLVRELIAAREALRSAQRVIDETREDLHHRRVADWHPEGANDAALQMSEDMRLIGNRLADVDFEAALSGMEE